MRQSDEAYSFKQFDSTQSIFVHIPKAAGISICNSLYGNFAGGHTSLSRYALAFSKGDFDTYFKFTIVRNPWDRLFSAYNFLKKGGINKWDQEWANNNLMEFRSFEQFVTEWVSRKNVRTHIHFAPQTDLISISMQRAIRLDFIGFFENLQSDFDYIKNRVNKLAVLSHENQQNSKGGKAYMQHYTNEMIDIVHSAYKNDVDILGYSFDNSSLPTQIENRNALYGKIGARKPD